MFKVISSFLLLTSILWGQEQVVRIRPPFSGLVQNTNQLDIPDNGFFILSNAALTSTGEIYKRGGFATFPVETTALKIDRNMPSRQIGVGNLYRYHKTRGGLRRLLATAIGANVIPGEGSTQDTTQFGHWYWLNDTTSRWAYTYHSTAPDTFSQAMYQKGRVRVQQDANHNSDYLTADSATFFLNCASGSDIKIDSANLSYGATGINIAQYATGVYVVNDTILVIERDSLINNAPGVDTLGNRRFEVRYRTAHTQTSSPTLYHAEAMTYLDTVYFSRGIIDPVGWDGRETFRANVVEQGVLTAFATPTRDTTKSWTINQWSGMWLFLRRANHRLTGGTGGNWRWKSNWYSITSNRTDSLVTNRNVDDSAYAIVSLPIDEVVYERPFSAGASPSNTMVRFDTLALCTYRNQKQIYAYPLQLLITQGNGAGKLYQIVNFPHGGTEDTLYIEPALEHSLDAGKSRGAVIRSRFPIAKFIKVFKERTLWISDTIFQNTIYPSIPGRPGYVEPNTEIVVNPNDGQRIQAAWTSEDAVFVAKESNIYALVVKSIETSGESPDIWQVVKVSATVGCESPKSVVQRENLTWFYDWPQGFYEMSGSEVKPISSVIKPTVDSITASARDKVWGVYYPTKKGDFILWGVPINGSTRPNRIICYSPQSDAWSTWNITNTDSLRINVAMVAEGPGDNGIMFVGLSDSAYVLRYNPDANQDTLKAQGATRTTTFSLTAQSKRFEIPGQQIRFAEIAPIVHNGGTATVAFDFFKNLSATVITGTQLAPSLSAGWQNFRKSLSDGVIGNQLAWQISTSSPQSFRLGGLDINIQPAGRRMPE